MHISEGAQAIEHSGGSTAAVASCIAEKMSDIMASGTIEYLKPFMTTSY
jgi:hypothetical protein